MIALQGLRVLPVALTISERRNLPELMEWLAGLGILKKL
jgi:hypothetical protein